MAKSFGTRKPGQGSVLPHQERVNLEMFRAIEQLGRKLERVQDERDRLARRLALIESAATVDEKTGKLYLPVAVEQGGLPQGMDASSQKWMVAASLMSSALALLALGIVLFRETPHRLTAAQLAALDAISTPRIAQYDSRGWKSLSVEEEQAPSETRVARAARPEAEAPAQVEPAAGEETAAAAPPPPAQTAQPVPETVAETVPEMVPETVYAQPAPVAEAEPAPAPEPEPPAQTASAEPEPVPAAEKAEKPAPHKTETVRDENLPAQLADLERRAFDGVPEAQHDLATLYASGKLVPQDYKRAVYWFSKAAEGGIANANYNLGVMFQQGLGVRQDVTKALGWYHRAADMNHPEAMYNLGIAYIEGVGTQQDIGRGVGWFKRAANAGVSQAAYNLGVLHESNFIGAIDLGKALEWYDVAAGEGHEEARLAALRLREQGVRAGAGPEIAVIEPAAGDEITGEGDASFAGDETPYDSLVARIQAVLMARGLLPDGRPSGRMDARTRDAISAFQESAGLPADGEASQKLLDRMLVEKRQAGH